MLSAFATAWFSPQLTVREALRGDAARLVIVVAWLEGVLNTLQTSLLRPRMEANWGPYAVFLAVFMGPLLGFLYYDVAGSVATRVSRLLGGIADVSDTRVALACGAIPELFALPLWIPAIGMFGVEIFTKAHPPRTDALLLFALLQIVLWLWAWVLRVAALAEANEFAIGRALLTVLLSWVAAVFVLVLAVGALASFVGR
jgi:hypothetical protein